jgi:hypothetical protein
LGAATDLRKKRLIKAELEPALTIETGNALAENDVGLAS